jgi:hypothetical protein
MGVKVDTDSIGRAEELMTLFGDEVMSRVGETKGAVSQKEMELFKEYSSNFGKTPEGNRAILRFKQAKLKRDIEIAKMVRKMQKNPMLTSIDIEEAIWNRVNEQDLSGMLTVGNPGNSSNEKVRALDERLKRLEAGG